MRRQQLAGKWQYPAAVRFANGVGSLDAAAEDGWRRFLFPAVDQLDPADKNLKPAGQPRILPIEPGKGGLGRRPAFKHRRLLMPELRGNDLTQEQVEAETPAVAEALAESEVAAETPPAEESAGGAMFTAPEGDADDLKKISGVGPVLEGKLNDLGITTFAQIAAFSAEDIAKVDEVLNFKGRIERDNWLEQAAEFAKG